MSVHILNVDDFKFKNKMCYFIIYLFLSIILLSVGFINGLSDNCLWRISGDLPRDKTPIYIGAHYELLEPTSGYIKLNRSNLLIVSCPGSNNYVVNHKGASSVSVKCDSSIFVKLNNQQRIKLKDLVCNTNPKADVRRSFDNRHLEIGFKTDNRFLKIIQVLYDFYNKTPMYSAHTIRGHSFRGYNERYDINQVFRTNGINSLNWAHIYSVNRVYEEVLVPLLSKEKADEIRNVTYLAKGHLTPAADFRLPSSKKATYFYANVVPQWQRINNGHWKTLENTIRNYAKYHDGDLKVYTGVYGVLRLKGVNNADVPIYLNGNTVPVPKYMWKVVCSQRNMCIGFVVLNHPFNNETISIEEVCKNICKDIKWLREAFGNNGKVICCDVNVLKANFNILKNLYVRSILNGP